MPVYDPPQWFDTSAGGTPIDAAALNSRDALIKSAVGSTEAVEPVAKYVPVTASRSAAAQAAIDAVNAAGGGRVIEDAGTFDMIGIVHKSNVTIQGQGPHATTWRLPNGSPSGSRVLIAENFDTNHLSDTGLGRPWYGVKNARLENIKIDGNKANNASGGDGFDFFGYNLRLFNVHVTNCKGNGIYNEAPRSFQIENEANQAGFIFRGDLVDVNNCDGDGFVHLGPTDSILSRSVLWKNAGANLKVLGRGGPLHMHQVHVYSGGGGTSSSNYGVYAAAPIRATDCDFESCKISACYLTGDTDPTASGGEDALTTFAGATASVLTGTTIYSNSYAGSAGPTLDGSVGALARVRLENCRFVNNLESIRVLGTVNDCHIEGEIDLSPGDVTVSGGPGNSGGTNPYLVTFGHLLANQDVSQITGANGTTPLSGGGASITTSTLFDGEHGVNEVQKIVVNATAGQFKLTYSGQTTANIAYNAPASDVEDALIALSNLAAGDLWGTVGGSAAGTFGPTNTVLLRHAGSPKATWYKGGPQIGTKLTTDETGAQTPAWQTIGAAGSGLTPSFINTPGSGVAATGGAFGNVEYRRDPFTGEVVFRGELTNNTGADLSGVGVLANLLPVGYRPPATRRFPSVSGASGACGVDVTAAGQITFNGTIPNGGSVTFMGIRYQPA